MKRLFGLFLGGFLLIGNMHSQTLEEAKKMYLEGNYAESKPIFEKALKSAPKNANYNQWYGTCLLETGEVEEARSYLEFAASKGIPGAYSSLGKLYFHEYEFEKSVDSYTKYKQVLEKKKQTGEGVNVDPMLEKAEKAARMLNHCEDVQIIDSIIIDKQSFLQYYPLSSESGSIRYTDDKKSIIYENQLQNKRYYAKPEGNAYKLYSQAKLADSWNESKLTLPSDSSGDDNFPFVLSDGVTIYYASDGNGSIGGYDLFVTRYNMNDDSYFAPEQLGMPFNSIYNDYMMAIDEYNGVGYFATDRFQLEGKVAIYTFIPNFEKKIIESEDLDYMKNRAEIKSIKDSWKDKSGYASLLGKIKDGSKNTKPEAKKDFDFVINDNLVYHTLGDFENDAAKDLFTQVQSLEQQISTLEQQLEQQRNDYSKGDASKKQSLSDSILSNEKNLEELQENLKSSQVKCRNTEIKYLRQQN